ncbi:MAG TPA: HAMP domain-containing sensor histidine kinase, partial [Acidimicrobiia bacterium]
TGPPIPDDVLPRIFDPFFTTKEPGAGTGLGLHTVHTIVNRIGGDVEVSSGDDGTVFTVRLPLGGG